MILALDVCLRDYAHATFEAAHMLVLVHLDIFKVFTGHISFLALCFPPLLSAAFYCSRCLSNFEHFRRYHEYYIPSPVNMIGFLPLSPTLPLFQPLSLPLSPLYRGGSQEKDNAVSSSIVSSVQSKITQVLFFAFIPDISST